ncbi:DUF6270 domain-containing protein [Bacillus sp. FJAT-27986]|uniref:DUF6270 domain-containing protein n=1 Tax=Bacillus sp. FJAT-27986 TaxID=1743146 RepID=UPI00080AE18A|nr:DUF6270 domain-containing protein [Bacillus sp. FJAT-27986]OCA84639.1 hypothetical protein A8L44_09560 [Bacillus sp. FJAT-27986]
MDNIKVAVLGSCATRDNFNSKFNPNYKEFYECILTQNQTSLISLMSSPLIYTENDIGELNDYDRWNVETDFSKSFLADLIKLEPTYLIVDFFADIHFGVISLETDQYITDNRWKLWKTPYYKRLKEKGANERITIIDNTEEYLLKWKQSVDKLFAFLNERLPECHVIIHKARNVSILNDNGTLVDLATCGRVKKENVQLLNQCWDELDQYVIDHYPVSVIEINDKKYHTYNEHPWGPFYVHYTEDYYHNFLLKLHRIVFANHINDHTVNKILEDIFKHHDDLKEKNEQLSQNLLNEMKVSEELQVIINLAKEEYHKELEKYKKESIITFLKRKSRVKVKSGI